MTIQELRNNFKFYFEEYQGSYYDALIVDSILDDLQAELEAKDKAIKEAIELIDRAIRDGAKGWSINASKSLQILKEAL